MITFATADTATLSKNADHGAFVALYLVKTKPGMSHKAFRTYELETHAPLAMALPGLLDYRLVFFPPQGETPKAFDALAQVTFKSEAAHDAAFGSAAGQRALADLPNVVDVSVMVRLVAETDDAYVAHLPKRE